MIEPKGTLAISVDVAGAETVAKTADKIADAGISGASAFLSRICLPAAEEFGLLIADKISGWRQRNAMRVAHKAEALQHQLKISLSAHAHPKLVLKAVNEGSMAEDDEVQNLWAGLIASSLSEGTPTDDNLIFMNLLAQLPEREAVLFSRICDKASKFKIGLGFVLANDLMMSCDDIKTLAGYRDFHILDLHLDHLREIGLLTPDGGFDPDSNEADVTPSGFGLQFYVRCQGYVGPPADYFRDTLVPEEDGETPQA